MLKQVQDRNIQRLSIRLLGNVFTVEKLKNALKNHFSTKHLLILNNSTKENLLKISTINVVKNVLINYIEKDQTLREKLLHGISERKKQKFQVEYFLKSRNKQQKNAAWVSLGEGMQAKKMLRGQ